MSGLFRCLAVLVLAFGAKSIPATTPYIETHTHFDEQDIEGSIRAAISALGRQNATKIVFQMPPDTTDRSVHFDAEMILAAVKKHPGKLAVLGGGETLNAMIHESVTSGNAGPDIQNKFRQR